MFNLPKYKYIFAVSDLVVIFISFFTAFYFSSGQTTQNIFLLLFDKNLGLVILLFFYSIFFIFIFQTNNLYKINIILTKSLHLISIIRSLFYGIISVIVFAFLIKYSFILNSRKFLIFFLISTFLLLIVVRFLILPFLYLKFAESNILKRKAIVIGAGKAGKLLTAKLIVEENLGLSVVGFVDDGKQEGEEILGDKKNLGKVSDLAAVIKKYDVEEIILSIDNISYERLLEIMDVGNSTGVSVKINSELFNIVPSKLVTEKYSNIPIINVSPQLNGTVALFFKRIIDYIASVIGLVILSPLLIIISLLIKLSSKGPVLYKQHRVGKDGRIFKFLKFRSMKVIDGEDEERKKDMIEFMKNGNSQNENGNKIINEKRLTWIGKLIRKTSLDELPQLINVLKGEMSLVGPRPCLPYEYENYDDWQKRRVSVLPGCTGVWQVFGRSNVSFKDSVILDLYYINNISPWLDLQLIFKTIPVMLFSKGGE